MDKVSLKRQYHKTVPVLQGPNINDLPPELLIEIMSKLSLFHRKRTREVCQYWNDISYDRSLIRNDWMVVPSVADLKKLEGRPPDRKFTNIRIKEVFDEYEESTIWEKFGPSIQKVEVHEIYDARNPVFTEIAKYCTDIKCLVLYRPHSKRYFFDEAPSRKECRKSEPVPFAELLPTNALSTLTSVKLARSPIHLTEAIFNSLNRNSQLLTEIVLDDCSALSTEEYSSINDLLKRQSKVLTHLTLSKISGERNLIDLLSCVGNQLISLNISNNDTLTDECLIEVCEHFPKLEEINLHGCKFSERGIKKIVESLKKLKSVSVGPNLTDNSLKDILCIDDLRKLDLTGCEGITEEGFVKAFSQRPLPKIEALIFKDIPSHFEDSIDVITRMVPNITFWDLSNSYAHNYAVDCIIKNNKALRTLILRGCDCLHDIFSRSYCRRSVNGLKELRELVVDQTSIIGYESLRYLRMKKLKKLSFDQEWEDSYFPADWDDMVRLLDVCPSLEDVCIPLEYSGIDEEILSPHALKVLSVRCFCDFSPEEHRTRECRP